MVIELHVPLTSLMSTIQTAVLDIVHFIVKEIKRLNPTVSFTGRNTYFSKHTVYSRTNVYDHLLTHFNFINSRYQFQNSLEINFKVSHNKVMVVN